MRLLLVLHPQPVHIEIGQCNFRTHQNDQFSTHLVLRRAAKQISKQRNTIENRKALIILALIVGDQTAKNDGPSIGGSHIGANITRGGCWNWGSVDYLAPGKAVDLLQDIERPPLLRVDQRHDFELE